MSDLIKRDEAVDAIYHHFPQVSKYEAWLILYEVSSVEPERKVGKWIKVMEGNAYRDKCSQCSDVYPNAYGYNYCPNCGSMMMRGERNEIN